MKLYIASDHAAFEEKNQLREYLNDLGHEVIDLGPDTAERCDYPVYAKKVADSVANESSSQGILLCGSGIGVSICANKVKGIRAALCKSDQEAKLSKEHNNANIICFGARLIDFDTIKKMTLTWLETEFAGGRHAERIALIE